MFDKKKRKTKTLPVRKVDRRFYGECELRQLPDNTYFKLVKRDGTLSKKVYMKEKGSYNRWSRKYDICSTDDMWCAGRELKGTTKVSTRFEY
ncbi:MAG: hypothetical protein J1F32_01835 [Erysipelotrichales bacterium]|nr:hypothetical protein [Erysipelotrichales bacterium]